MFYLFVSLNRNQQHNKENGMKLYKLYSSKAQAQSEAPLNTRVVEYRGKFIIINKEARHEATNTSTARPTRTR